VKYREGRKGSCLSLYVFLEGLKLATQAPWMPLSYIGNQSLEKHILFCIVGKDKSQLNSINSKFE
jgi:hypothetical protein